MKEEEREQFSSEQKVRGRGRRRTTRLREIESLGEKRTVPGPLLTRTHTQFTLPRISVVLGIGRPSVTIKSSSGVFSCVSCHLLW
jgi:hypothetical protein